ncbi:MAG: hypothetical protein F6K28_57325, partial [Microcoleus sp. SIO2G3]|nr:hypothetical protein [Microcoleus sp. SIO2G3]
YKAIYQPNALVFHSVSKERMTYNYFDQRHFYQGVCESYTDIRQSNGKLRQVSLIDKIKAPLRFLKTIGLKLLNLPNENLPNEKDALNERFYQAYQRGYQFHQNAVRLNPGLLDWILRKDYWDYKLPNRHIKIKINNSLLCVFNVNKIIKN